MLTEKKECIAGVWAESEHSQLLKTVIRPCKYVSLFFCMAEDCLMDIDQTIIELFHNHCSAAACTQQPIATVLRQSSLVYGRRPTASLTQPISIGLRPMFDIVYTTGYYKSTDIVWQHNLHHWLPPRSMNIIPPLYGQYQAILTDNRGIFICLSL